MRERQRFLALLDIYDEAIEELYVLGDRRLVELILRLERRRRVAESQLAALEETILSPVSDGGRAENRGGVSRPQPERPDLLARSRP